LLVVEVVVIMLVEVEVERVVMYQAVTQLSHL
jgi:hypothetical protein